MTPASTGPGVVPTGGDSVPNERTALAWTRTAVSQLTVTASTLERSGSASQFAALDQLPLAPPIQVESGRTVMSAIVAAVALKV